MGISLSWVATEALPANEALARLALTPTGNLVTFPFKGIATKPLPENWTLVTAGRCDHRVARPESMSALSPGCRAVACNIEEHVNYASAELWQDGNRVWRVEHQGEEDSTNMTSEGQPPRRFQALLLGVEPEDSENLDGYFHMDIPLMLAKEIVGFRHDVVNDTIDSTPFEELREMAKKKSWWKPWQ